MGILEGNRLGDCDRRFCLVGFIIRNVRIGLGVSQGSNPIGLLTTSLMVILLLLKGAQNSVNKGGGIGIRQGLGQGQGLIDGYLVRNLRVVEHLPGGDTQNVAVNGMHPAQRPSGGMGLQSLIDISTMLCHTLDNGHRISRQRCLSPRPNLALFQQGKEILALLIGLIQGIQGPLAGCGTCHGCVVSA